MRVARSPEQIYADFLAKIEKLPSGCWEYRGTIEKCGYGVLQIGKKQWRAHRYMYVQVHGPVTDDVCILHKCDNRPCVNPDHLYAGSHCDNMRDKGQRGGSDGMRNGRAKITDDQVREIRRLYDAKELTQVELAARFGIGQSAISEIVRRTHWTHIK